MKFFHHSLYVCKFLIRTDHVSLCWLMFFKELEGQLARCLEGFQQHDFEVVHRKGVAHKNADGLSRRSDKKNRCNYCSKVEFKENRDSSDVIRRIVFEGNDLSKFCEQLNNQAIAIILQRTESERRSTKQEISSLEVLAKIYGSQWDVFIIENEDKR